MRGALAGLAYFGLVFTLGAMLGTVRTLVLEPRLGAVPSVLIELPFMLLASWAICRWIAARLAVPVSLRQRLAMGGTAFFLLVSAELLLSIFIAGGSASAYIAACRTPAGLIGLAGQLAFALFPLSPCLSARKAP